MATTTSVNGQTVVHETSGGILNTAPDVCKTQVGPSVVPIPYSNTAVSKDTSKGSTSVFVDGNPLMLKDAVFSKSTGDEPGTIKGVGSGTTGGEAKFTNYSFDVMVEGRNVCRRLDLMTSNKGNTPPSPLMQPNVAGAAGIESKYLLPIAFVFKHPDVSTERVRQPLLTTPHTASGPETFKCEEGRYVGVLHRCTQEGEYKIEFDPFDLEEKPLSNGKDEIV